MFRQFAFAIAALLGAAGCKPHIGVDAYADNVVIAVPAVPGGPGAAYFTVNANRGDHHLVSISSAAFDRAELHDTMQHGDMMTMSPLRPDQLVATPSTPLVFAPGGKHAMLFGVPSSLRPGAQIDITFTFEGGLTATAVADVVGPGQTSGH